MSRRRAVALWTVVVLAPLLLAMGGGGGGPVTDTIPRPKENFRARLVDRQGVATRVELLSADGRTFVPLERGEGTLLVPFAKIRRLTTGAEDGTRIRVSLETARGDSLEGRVPRTLVLTGVTEFGNYRIEARGLRELVFEGG